MEWVKLFTTTEQARASLKENRPQLAIVHGTRICLVLRENTIYAVADRCTHNGESLSKGAVNYLGDVVCPWHGYRFSLQSGREANEQSRDLTTYPIRETGDGVFIGI